ncbi:hypothetical protein GCM10009737_08410 [Nocardioides lentus]|uniref:PH regulation protein F n=1 Tax=Nocardioides lentus TaxID=338077 RepID=A0ABP5AE65_9ACTN
MIDETTADIVRCVYAALAIIAGCGFVATLIIRWDVLQLGEKILRTGLVVEHVVITYGAYTALQLDYPPTAVGLAMTAALAVVISGFAVWVADIVLHGDDGPIRLTDHR